MRARVSAGEEDGSLAAAAAAFCTSVVVAAIH